ncbi:hypothetical protein RCO48_12980 [Peribacillus frigoritolerans]|nr:hypothetical protein [Peribacillus frigoritolerans]
MMCSILVIHLESSNRLLMMKKKTKVGCRENEYEQVKDFIFNELLPPIEEYMDEEQADPTYFGSLPFFHR